MENDRDERDCAKMEKFIRLGFIRVIPEIDGTARIELTDRGYSMLRKERLPGERADH